MSRTIRNIVIAVVLIGVIGWLVYYALTRPMEVDAAAAQRTTIDAYIEEQAKTRLPRTYRVTMPIDGRVLPIDLTEGDDVHAGQVVAQLELADLETAVAEARARVQRLEASIVRNNDTRSERTMLEEIAEYLNSVQRSVEAAAAETEASKAREDFYEQDLTRKRTAFEQGAATQTELDEAQLSAIQGRVDYHTDVLQLRALEAIYRASQLLPQNVQQEIDKKQLSEAVLLHEKEEAEAQLELAIRNRERSVLRSPVDGVVLRRAVSNLRVLPAGELLLEIGDLRELEIEAEVLSDDAATVDVGDTVEFYGATLGPTPVNATVTRIEPQGFTKISSLGVEQQRVLVIMAFDEDARRTLQDAGRTLGVDYRLRVRIITDRRDRAVVIPRSALFRNVGDRWQAFVIRSGRARLVTLQVGIMNDRHVQVLKGLEPGDEVILAPDTSLEDGDRVTARTSG